MMWKMMLCVLKRLQDKSALEMVPQLILELTHGLQMAVAVTMQGQCFVDVKVAAEAGMHLAPHGG
jgi:hypothetical protein